MKPRSDYFKPGEHHLCMFCSTPIAKLVDGRLKALGNKAHVLMEKKKGGLYSINCCGDCAKNQNFKDENLLKDIHEAIVECKKRLGSKPDEDDCPVKGFYRAEESPKQRERIIREYKEHARKL